MRPEERGTERHEQRARAGSSGRPMLMRSPVFREWAAKQSHHSNTENLLCNGYVAAAVKSSDGLPREVLQTAARAYLEAGWLDQAATAFELADDREGVRDVASRWLDLGLFEEAQLALDQVSLRMTEEMLDRYRAACSRHRWQLHLGARTP